MERTSNIVNSGALAESEWGEGRYKRRRRNLGRERLRLPTGRVKLL